MTSESQIVREVVSGILQELRREEIRVADSAQSELHRLVRDRIAAGISSVNAGMPPKLIDESVRAFVDALRVQAPEAEHRVVRKPLLRRLVDNLGPIWPFGNG